MNIKIKISESQAQAAIIEYLLFMENSGKLMIQRTNNMGVYDKSFGGYRKTPEGFKKGFPDIFILKDGIYYGIETKSSDGKQSKDQKKMQKLIEKNGGKYVLARGVEEVMIGLGLKK